MIYRLSVVLSAWGLLSLSVWCVELACADNPPTPPAISKSKISDAPNGPISHTDVFRSGKDGYHSYRIPAIVRAKDGTLLAFAEGRKDSRSDSGDIDIVLRRSTDDGKTWGPMQVVADHGKGCVGNPCPVVDEKSGDIVLVTTRQTPGSTQRSIRSGKKDHNRSYYVQRSSDHGKTFSKPKRIDVTDALKPRWLAGGPNHALQLKRGEHAGRILVAGNHSTGKEWDTNVLHVIYSDDGGRTWQLGATCPGSETVWPSEAATAELPDETIIFFIRNQKNLDEPSPAARAFGFSCDGGESFDGPLYPSECMTAPICHGSILEFSAADQGDETNCLVVSYPNDPKQRKNLCIRTSTDGGKTWDKPLTIYPDSSAYSDLIRTSDRHLGILYERDNYSRITFALTELCKGN